MCRHVTTVAELQQQLSRLVRLKQNSSLRLADGGRQLQTKIDELQERHAEAFRAETGSSSMPSNSVPPMRPPAVSLGVSVGNSGVKPGPDVRSMPAASVRASSEAGQRKPSPTGRDRERLRWLDKAPAQRSKTTMMANQSASVTVKSEPGELESVGDRPTPGASKSGDFSQQLRTSKCGAGGLLRSCILQARWTLPLRSASIHDRRQLRVTKHWLS